MHQLTPKIPFTIIQSGLAVRHGRSSIATGLIIIVVDGGGNDALITRSAA